MHKSISQSVLHSATPTIILGDRLQERLHSLASLLLPLKRINRTPYTPPTAIQKVSIPIVVLTEEHNYLEIHEPAHVGEKVWVVPSHVCPTVNLHDEIWYGRRGRVEGSWKVAARGKVR